MARVATMSADHQIEIPEEVRTERSWEPGQEFVFLPRDGGVFLVAVPRLEDLRGIAGDADPTGYRDRNDRF